jgi:hypothetical protein
MPAISQICQNARTPEEHRNCPLQQPYDHEYQNCQCDCHPGTIPATSFGGEIVDKPP